METVEPKQKKVNLKINTCNSRHELALLKELIKKNNWSEEYIKDKFAKCDVFWLAGPDRENYFSEIIEHSVIFNHLPGSTAASNKSKFAQIMKLYKKHDENTFSFTPRTFTLP